MDIKDATGRDMATELERRMKLNPASKATTFCIAFGTDEFGFDSMLGGRSDCLENMLTELVNRWSESLKNTSNSGINRSIPLTDWN